MKQLRCDVCKEENESVILVETGLSTHLPTYIEYACKVCIDADARTYAKRYMAGLKKAWKK